jgi:hypothetical protein
VTAAEREGSIGRMTTRRPPTSADESVRLTSQTRAATPNHITDVPVGDARGRSDPGIDIADRDCPRAGELAPRSRDSGMRAMGEVGRSVLPVFEFRRAARPQLSAWPG